MYCPSAHEVVVYDHLNLSEASPHTIGVMGRNVQTWNEVIDRKERVQEN